MACIEQDLAVALLEHVAAADPELLPACRWLVLGRQLAPLILEQEGRAPVFSDLVRLLRAVAGQTPELEQTARSMVASNEMGTEAQVEAGLEQLVEADAARWAHPVQVLSRPRPELGALLVACGRRLESAADETRERLLSVKGKLVRAVRIEDSARRRRGAGAWSGD